MFYASVVFNDDSAAFRAALKDPIRADDDLELVGSAAEATDDLRLASELHPDVFIADREMPLGRRSPRCSAGHRA